MFRTIVLSAAGAGLAACVAVSALQAVTTEPLIFHAETFEGAGEAAPADHVHAPGEAAHDHAEAAPPAEGAAASDHHHDPDAWSPADGFERAAYTALANLVIGVGVSLMLLGVMALRGEAIDARRGVLFGLAGFAAASLLPAIGLPPELPGTPAADIDARQLWWLGTALASAAGLWLLAFGGLPLQAAGLVLLVAPHVIGAPHPPSLDAPYPAVLAIEFVTASLLVSGVLWVVAGGAAGWLYSRLSRAA